MPYWNETCHDDPVVASPLRTRARTAEPHIADRMKQVSVSSVFVVCGLETPRTGSMLAALRADKRVPVTNTPKRPHTWAPTHPHGYPRECQNSFQIIKRRKEIVNSNLNFRSGRSKLKFVTRRSKRHGPKKKNNSA